MASVARDCGSGAASLRVEAATLGDDPAAASRSQALPPTPASVDFDVVARTADVIVVWNVLQHFWPYWDTVAVDWIAELDTAPGDALDDHSVQDQVATLLRLSAAAPDGHARIGCSGVPARAILPFDLEVIEGQIVVTVTNSDGSRFHLLGVQPTIPATQTIAGIAAGRDEVLERALRYIRTGS